MPLARASTLHTRLEPVSPGRVLLHIPEESRSTNQLEAVRALLNSHPDVEAVEIDSTTGTVMILGCGGGAVGGAVADFLEVVRGEMGNGRRLGHDRALRMLRSVDGRIRARTGGRLSLTQIVPAAVIGLAVQIVIARSVSSSSRGRHH